MADRSRRSAFPRVARRCSGTRGVVARAMLASSLSLLRRVQQDGRLNHRPPHELAPRLVDEQPPDPYSGAGGYAARIGSPPAGVGLRVDFKE